LRQAYDYWQDQPGNYYPLCSDTNGTEATFTDGSSFKLVEELIAA